MKQEYYETLKTLLGTQEIEKFMATLWWHIDKVSNTEIITDIEKINLLLLIAGNPFISDKNALTLYKPLQFKQNDDLDGTQTKSGYSPLFLGFFTDKRCFSEQLIADGANPFSRLNNASETDNKWKYPLLMWYKKFGTVAALTPFNYLLLKGAPNALLRQYLNKYLERVRNFNEILEIPIDTLKERSLFSKLHRKILCDRLLAHIEILTVDPSYKEQLKLFLLKDDTSIQGFHLLNRIKAVSEIAHFIQNPYTQRQFDTNLCGPNTFFMCVALYAPNVFVHMAISLLNKGLVHFPIKLKTNDHINQTCESISILLYKSLKNAHKKSSFDYINDSTWPAEIVVWLQNMGCQNIEDRTIAEESVTKTLRPMIGWMFKHGIHPKRDLFHFDFELELKRMIDLCQKKDGVIWLVRDGALCAKINAQIFDWPPSMSFCTPQENNQELLLRRVGIEPDLHWVVLKAIKLCENNTVDVTIYTQGVEMRFNLSKEDLRSLWLGAVSFTLPENLRVCTFKSLNIEENQLALGSEKTRKP